MNFVLFVLTFCKLVVLDALPQGMGSEPIISIQQGPVKGIRQFTDTRTTVFAFLGIPYAVPPLGKNRFSAPERHSGWPSDKPFSAVEFGPACIQPRELEPSFGNSGVNQDEDCLALNVWTSEATIPYRNAPVVIFLEGEGFVTGYSGRFPGQDLAAEGVVVVSVNYRLNVFGFLCLGDQESRGNVGLLDQYLALVWVRENIEAFGGDPRTITMMGHSAGAASIVYHMTSPRTQGLFHRAIIMSGSIFSPWIRSPNPSNASKEIARSLGCFFPKTSDVLTCMRTKSSTEILKAFETQYMNGNWTELPLPVIDNFLPDIEQYLPLDPREALEKGAFLQIPVMTGITRNEGAVTVTQWADLAKQNYLQLKQLFLNSIMPSIAYKYELSNLKNFKEIETIIRGYYLDQIREGDVMALISKIIDLYSDAQFKAPYDKQLQKLSENRNVPSNSIYAYQFQQDENNLYKHLNISGSGHGEELLYLFGSSLMKKIGREPLSRVEERLGSVMRRFWVEFITKGILGLTPYGYGISWRRYSKEENNYVIFRAENKVSQSVMDYPSIKNEEMSKQMTWIWNELLPNLKNLRINESNQISKEMKFIDNITPYRSATYTLIAFVVILLVLLVICVFLLKKHATERERDMF